MKNLSFGYRIIILFSVFVLGLLFTTILSQGLSFFPISQNSILLLTMTIQDILVFILPAFILAIFINRNNPIGELTLNIMPSLKGILAIIIIFIVATPALNAIVAWNESITLPDSMKEVEISLRNIENMAASIIDNLLINTSLLGLICSILIIGLLTGIGEELFFRGSLQRILVARPMNKHLAIWVTAIVFSLLHFQFFGFVTRIIIGAFFCYLYVWSGTIWLPIIAHAVNNSIVIVAKYCALNGYSSTTTVDEIGTTPGSMPIVLISIALTIVAIMLSKKYLFDIKKD